jgi:large subunit ribosomal protein L36
MWGHLSRTSRILQPSILNSFFKNALRNFSVLSNSSTIYQPTSMQSSILQPASILINIQRGMKQVGRVKRRCKDCYFYVKQERFFVFCKTHPRHKQMAMIKKPKSTWILTDATQSITRAW